MAQRAVTAGGLGEALESAEHAAGLDDSHAVVELARAAPPASVRGHCSYDERRSLRRRRCGNLAMSLASAIAASSAVPVGTRRLASPMRSASSPDTPRPVRIMSSAWLWPMRRAQPHRAAVHQRHAPAAAEHAEHGVLGRDAQVAPQRQLEPAGDGVAFDRRDRRLRQQHARDAQRTVAVSATRLPRPLGDRLQVGAGAERAVGAGQHGDARARRRRRSGETRRPAPRRSARSTALRTSGRSMVTIAIGPSVSQRTAFMATSFCSDGTDLQRLFRRMRRIGAEPPRGARRTSVGVSEPLFYSRRE